MKPRRQQTGFSLLDVLLIILGCAAIALVVFLPYLARSRARSAKISCTNNLKQVGLAFRIWAGDNDDKFPMQVSITNGGAMELAQQGSAYEVFLVMSNELSTPKVLFCPDEDNPNRQIATVFAATLPPRNPNGPIPFTATNNLSYFVGLDAEEAQPNTIISGDDHFSVNGVQPNRGLFLLSSNAPVAWRKGRHTYGGNIGLADGSVQNFSDAALVKALADTGVATNRLAMP